MCPICSVHRSRSHRTFSRPAWLLFFLVLFACALAAVRPAVAQEEGGTHSGKPVLAVLKFQDETGRMMMQGGVGRALTNMLASELAARGAFNVVERRKLNAILEEQNLVQAGLLKPGEGAKIGMLTGAQYLVMGTVTAYEEASRTSGGLRLFGATIGGDKKQDYLALDLRVVDTTTGEVSFARSIEGRAEKNNVSVGTAIVGFSHSGGAPESKAVRAGVIEIIDYLECAMVRRDACLARYQEKDQRRIQNTRKAINLDGDKK